MTSYVALLRAVNVGGTGKLPMSELKAMCIAAKFKKVQTYIARAMSFFPPIGLSRKSRPRLRAPESLCRQTRWRPRADGKRNGRRSQQQPVSRCSAQFGPSPSFWMNHHLLMR